MLLLSLLSFLFMLFVLSVCAILLYTTFGSRDDCTVIRTWNTENGTIEIVDDMCQEGLPHTTNPNTIRMTESVYNSDSRDEILSHERVHLDQKQNPRRWEEFYKRWDYELFSTPPSGIPSDLRSMLRPNPDTSSKPWAVWRGRYVFFPITESGSLRNATVVVWDTHTNQRVNRPSEWQSQFCHTECPHQYEHPHEIAAEFLAKGHSSPAATKLFQWIQHRNE